MIPTGLFLRFPRTVLALVALLLFVCVFSLARVSIDSQTRVLLEGDQRNLSSYEKISDLLEHTTVVVIAVRPPNLFTREGIRIIREISEALQRSPGVLDVKSLSHSVKPVRKGLSFEMRPLVPDESTPALAKLKHFATHHPLMKNIMVSEDGSQALITVTYQDRFETRASKLELKRVLTSILQPWTGQGVQFTTLGLPLIEVDLYETFVSDLRRIVPGAVLLVLCALAFTFRSVTPILLILVNQVAAVISIPALLSRFGFHFTVFSVILLPLLAAIQLTLLVHLHTALRRALRQGLSGRAALQHALEQVRKPCAFATLTTVFGMLSLALSDMPQIRDFGIMGALGLSFIHLLSFGPGLSLTLIALNGSQLGSSPDSPPRTQPADFTSDRISGWVSLLQKQRSVLLVVALLPMILAALLASRIRTDLRAVEFLSSTSETRKAVEGLDRSFGGINVVQLDIDSGRDRGIHDPGLLEFLATVQAYAEKHTAFSAAYSFPQLLAMMNEIWENEAPGSFKLPTNPILRTLFISTLSSQNYPFLRALCDSKARTAHLVLRSRDMPVNRYLAAIEDVVKFARERQPPGVRVSARSGIHTILESDRRILDSQLQSMGATFLLIFLALATLWRSLLLPWLALATNAIPVAVVVILAVVVSIPLNSITILVAAISLGMAVDNSVHFLTQWREHRAKGVSTTDAVQRTQEALFHPILASGSMLSCLLLLFCASSFPPIRHFGLLSAAAMISATAATLLFLPALLARNEASP